MKTIKSYLEFGFLTISKAQKVLDQIVLKRGVIDNVHFWP